jgi:2-polyprenyl-6-hydroxyphenyl methylase/3-demethylubiquinone-9 3-methyltransferase
MGRFDVVYSWGVLHHTGQMWAALGNVAPLVADGGRLLVAIYNDQGRMSRVWHAVKRAYNALPPPLRFLVVGPSLAALWGPATLRDFAILRPFHTWRSYASRRGMAPYRDLVDWVGGYPFEVARPEEIFDFYRARGFTLLRLTTMAGGHGCNELLFARSTPGAAWPAR